MLPGISGLVLELVAAVVARMCPEANTMA